MLALVGPAATEPMKGWYMSIEGGGEWIENVDIDEFTTPPGGAGTTSALRLDPGWVALTSVGYALESHWRLEIEGGYRYNQFDNLTPIGGPVTYVDGHYHRFTAMANGIYDFVGDNGTSLSLGGGIGANYARIDSRDLANPFNDDDIGLAVQAVTGLSVPVSNWLDVSLNYRFLYAPHLTLEDDASIAPASANIDIDDQKSHTVTLGFRFGSRGEPVQAVAAREPEPPQPQVPRQFLIFFGFNKCNITANADMVLSEAANAVRQLGTVAVQISGHTDTVGSLAANQRLSECRANAARDNLVGKGVPLAAITTRGYGEGQLLIQTGDGVKEPQNRRVNVDLN